MYLINLLSGFAVHVCICLAMMLRFHASRKNGRRKLKHVEEFFMRKYVRIVNVSKKNIFSS